MSKIQLSESVHPQSLRRRTRSTSLFQYIRSIFTAERMDFLELFTRDAKDISNYEQLLYVEPRHSLYPLDYVWQDAEGRTSEIDFKYYTNTDELMALVADGRKKGIFLFGDMACGKSTFVDHFRQVFLAEVDKGICILLDFSQWVGRILSEQNYSDMKSQYLKELGWQVDNLIEKKNLYEEYGEYVIRNAKHRDFRVFMRALDDGRKVDQSELESVMVQWQNKNPRNALSRGSRFLRSKGFNILVILDNVDPIPAFYQERFARDALELIHMAHIQMILTLRFFSLEKMTNVVGDFRTFTFMKLELPPIRDLIQKRVKYFLCDKLQKEEYRIPWQKVSLTVSRERLIELIQYVNQNLLSDEFIQSLIFMSDMNVRQTLLNYLAILDSKHVDLSPKVISAFFDNKHRKPGYVFNMRTQDLLLKSVITNKRILFSYSSSRVENVFNVYSPHRGDYFPNLLKIYLLEMVYRLTVHRVDSEDQRSFVEKEVIFSHAKELGWEKPCVSAALGEMFFRGLLFGYEADSFEFNDRIALSNSGIYYYSTLTQTVYYMFFMLFDFPMSESRVEKYFDRYETSVSSGYRYRLKAQYPSILDDNVVHLLVGQFLLELTELESLFIRKALYRNNRAVKTFEALVRLPLSLRLIDSFAKHVRTRKERDLEPDVRELFNARKRLHELAVQLIESKHHRPIHASSILLGKCANDDVVLFSHSASDRSIVLEIGEELRRRGALTSIGDWELEPGVRWEGALRKEMNRVRAVVMLVGFHGDELLLDRETKAFLSLAVQESKPVILVLLSEAEEAPTLPVFLSHLRWVSLQDSIRDQEALDSLEWGITGTHSHRHGD